MTRAPADSDVRLPLQAVVDLLWEELPDVVRRVAPAAAVVGAVGAAAEPNLGEVLSPGAVGDLGWFGRRWHLVTTGVSVARWLRHDGGHPPPGLAFAVRGDDGQVDFRQLYRLVTILVADGWNFDQADLVVRADASLRWVRSTLVRMFGWPVRRRVAACAGRNVEVWQTMLQMAADRDDYRETFDLPKLTEAVRAALQ